LMSVRSANMTNQAQSTNHLIDIAGKFRAKRCARYAKDGSNQEGTRLEEDLIPG